MANTPKTVIYANVDGFDIVLGISDAVLDPMATSAMIAEPLAASAEIKAMAALNAQIDAGWAALNTASTQEQWNARKAAIDDLAEQIPALGAAIDARRSALMAQYAVWCQPGSGENLITEDQAAAYTAAAKPGVKVKLDGTTVPDNRNTIYWTLTGSNWASTTITNLGDVVPTGSIADGDLTDAQRTTIAASLEIQRVSGLTDAQKLAEATAQVQAAKATVAGVQSQVTAGVSTQADLTAALAAYKAMVNAVNAKYGTSLT